MQAVNGYSIDFETRSKVDIDQGLHNYFSQGRVLCLAYGGRVWVPGQADPTALLDHVRRGGVISGWNVLFEYLAWNKLCVPLYGWPVLKLEQCVDTMAQAAAANVPQGLGDCARFLKTTPKDAAGDKLIKLLCVPQKDGQFNDDPQLLEQLYKYCAQDVAAEAEISEMLPNLPEVEQQVWEMTQRINENGVPIDKDAAQRIDTVIKCEAQRLEQMFKKLTNYQVTTVNQTAKILQWCAANGYELPNLQAATVEQALDDEDMPDVVWEALRCRQNAAKSSVRKVARLLELENHGRIYGLLTYHGASTGRFASRSGLNAQNLPRPRKDINLAYDVLSQGDHDWAYTMLGDEVMEYAVSTLRHLIKAPAGYEFIDADYSSVENRVAAWIAGQDDRVEMFAKGLDEYKVFASAMYNVPYEAVSGEQRRVAKSAVLGSMFGQGARGLVRYAKGMGVEVSFDQATQLVDTYRRQYFRVKTMWHNMAKVAMACIRDKGKVQKLGLCYFTVKDNFLCLKLPSGRVIRWYAPYIGKGKYGAVVKYLHPRYGHKELIGSSIFQSAVQATARDLLCHGSQALMDAGYKVILLVHDEILSEVPIGSGDEHEYMDLMCSKPKWAESLPLAAESWRGERYRK